MTEQKNRKISGHDQQVRKELAMEIIDAILDQSDHLCFATHYGMPSLLVADIIHIINQTADTGYKQLGGGFIRFDDWGKYETDSKCEMCRNFFANDTLSRHKDRCPGCRDASRCESYQRKV